MDSKRIVAESGIRRVPVPTVYYTDPDPQYWISGRVEVLVDYRYMFHAGEWNRVGYNNKESYRFSDMLREEGILQYRYVVP